jgi:hypothetical protein
MKKDIKRNGVNKIYNIQIKTLSIKPGYVVNVKDSELIGETGLLRIFEISSGSLSKPQFYGRWDQVKQTMDIDIFNVDHTTKKMFLKSNSSCVGHHPDLVNINNRAFNVEISILGDKFYNGIVSFCVQHRLYADPGNFILNKNN